MKKIFCIVLMLSAITSGVFGQSGVIREFTGSVELKHSGSASFTPAQTGSTVVQNTIISTGFRSTAVIDLGSSVITVRPLTRLSLTEIISVSNSEDINVNLQTGKVRVDVKPPAGKKVTFSVQSPMATASVRGTSFEFDTVNLSVSEGRVIFGGNYGTAAMVSAGESSYIETNGTPADPADVNTAALLPHAPVGTELMPETQTQRPANSQITVIPVY